MIQKSSNNVTSFIEDYFEQTLLCLNVFIVFVVTFFIK